MRVKSEQPFIPMNQGFEVHIQRDLTPEQRRSAISYVNHFIATTCADSHFRYFGKPGGGYTSGLWRGCLGLNVTDDLVFRRIAKNARRFAVVKLESLEVHNDKLLDKAHSNYRDVQPDGGIPNMCKCPRHRASLRVRFKKIPEMELYARIGEVKG